MALTLRSRIVVADAQVSTTVGGEVVILAMHDGVYYGLDAVGARLWSLLQAPSDVSALVTAIVSEFDVSESQCATDVLALLENLLERGLVREAA